MFNTELEFSNKSTTHEKSIHMVPHPYHETENVSSLHEPENSFDFQAFTANPKNLQQQI